MKRVIGPYVFEGGGAKSLNYQSLARDLGRATLEIPFNIPSYFALIARALGILEGSLVLLLDGLFCFVLFCFAGMIATTYLVPSIDGHVLVVYLSAGDTWYPLFFVLEEKAAFSRCCGGVRGVTCWESWTPVSDTSYSVRERSYTVAVPRRQTILMYVCRTASKRLVHGEPGTKLSHSCSFKRLAANVQATC